MAKIIYLPQTKLELPILDQELIYADVGSILFKSIHQKFICNNLTNKQTQQIKFYTSVNTVGVNPRFDLDDYVYKITPDNDLTPLINLSNKLSYDFFDLTDTKSIELLNLSLNCNEIFIFWSGGIDSTLVLAAILKNWKDEFLKKIVVVCNKNSIDEHPRFYEKFIHDKLKTIDSDLFYTNQIKFDKSNTYISSDVGDLIIGYNKIQDFNQEFPGIYNKSYKKHSKEIIKYFGNDQFAYYSYSRILKSIKKHNLEIETVYDFLWWIEFNWGWGLDYYGILWYYSILPEELDTKEFLIKNNFNWFSDIRYQYWSVQSIGSNLKIRDSINSYKYVYRKYIYDFDKDLDYFLYKTKEDSFPKNEHVHHGNKLLAIDKNWNLYYR